MQKKSLKAFTLVEMLIVVAILVVTTVAIFGTSFLFRDQLTFKGASDALSSFANEVRSLALSIQSYPDTTDHDGDGLLCPDPAASCDKVLPNGYILTIDGSGENVVLSINADIFSDTGTIDTLDASDPLIRQYTLPEDVSFNATAVEGSTGIARTLGDTVSVIYKTTEAEYFLLGSLLKDSLQIELRQTDSNENYKRGRYFYWHYSGNFETSDKPIVRGIS